MMKHFLIAAGMLACGAIPAHAGTSWALFDCMQHRTFCSTMLAVSPFTGRPLDRVSCDIMQKRERQADERPEIEFVCASLTTPDWQLEN